MLPAKTTAMSLATVSRLPAICLFFSTSMAAASAISARSPRTDDDLVLDGLHRVLDAVGVFGGIPCQVADVGGHDREALAELAGPRRLDRAVDRQHVGLDRHGRDGIDDLVDTAADLLQRGDLLAALASGFNRRRHPGDHLVDRLLAADQNVADGLALLQPCLGAGLAGLGALSRSGRWPPRIAGWPRSAAGHPC